MKICILAGGPAFLLPPLIHKDENEVWIGVDRGAQQLIQLGIQPDYAFGDFDSLEKSEGENFSKKTEIFSYPPEKDQTDLELALDWALSKKPRSIEVYGATGGRLDHEWVNLQLLKKGTVSGTNLTLRDKNNLLTAKSPGHYTLHRMENFPYVSFLPLFESIKGLTLEGFKYPLSNAEVKAGETLTVSNELIAETGTYSLVSGIVLVIRSRDGL